MPLGARKNIGLVLGILISVIGVVGVLFALKVIKFKLPLSVTIASWILFIGGIYLIIESLTELGMQRSLGILVAIICLVFSGIPLFMNVASWSFSLTTYYFLLTVEGLFLIINSFGT